MFKYFAIVLLFLLPTVTHSFKTYVSFTVDDTLSEHFQMADTFDQYGVKATFYINSARVDQPDSLTLAEVRAMEQNGHEIGGHTLTHPNLRTLTSEEQKVEICQDRKQLLEWGISATSFAYPFGSDTDDTFRILSECGYNTARDSGGIRTNTSCLGCPVGESIPPQNPLQMRSISYDYEVGVGGIKSYINQAQTGYYDTWIMFILHEFGDYTPEDKPQNIKPSELNDVLEWMQSQSYIEIKSVHEMTAAQTQPIFNTNGLSKKKKEVTLRRKHKQNTFCEICPCGCPSETTLQQTTTTSETTTQYETTTPPETTVLPYPGIGNNFGAPYIVLTFDFGTSDHNDVASILEQYGMRGVFFVSSANMGNAGYMTQTEITSLQERGHEIGSRTKTGANLLPLTSTQQFGEICEELQTLEGMGLEVKTISWPSGANNQNVEDMASGCGFTYGRDIGGLKGLTSCLSCPTAVSFPFEGNSMKLRSANVRTPDTLGNLFWQVWRDEENGEVNDPRVLIFDFSTVCDGCSFSPKELHQFLTWLYPRTARGTTVTTFSSL
jgi:peptidoglycan/xylan/chitin deacetylase (PgdA/CDA1 family)